MWLGDSKGPSLALCVCCVLLLLLLAACGVEPEVEDGLAEIRASGELVVLTRNGPTTVFEGRDGPDGFEHALAQALGDALGVPVRYEVYDSIKALLAAVRRGRGHLAAAGITRTEEREGSLEFGPDYKAVQQQVVCNRERVRPKEVRDLLGRALLVVAGSSYDERLRELQVEHPELEWETTNDLETEQVMEMVWRGEADCTVADSNIVAINRRYYPELIVAFAISEEQPLAWPLAPVSGELKEYLGGWFAGLEDSGHLDRLNERFYGHVQIFDYVDLRAFKRRVDARLPKYRALFEEAAAKHDLRWTLLAAQAYQESHWNPKAKSPTGVRGIMMLTLPTAKAMGVKSRLDASQSIFGGAKYLARMERRLPAEVQGEDRIWFALAAYNVGMGHLQDARALAKRLGRDPNSWHAMQEVLPLLAQKKYYRTLPRGYARGLEPVRYVQRIRGYEDIIERLISRAQLGSGQAAAAPAG